MKTDKKIINNTIMMYLMTVAKLVIPLISLPYLTRVLSVDCYGSVAFVKSLMNYFQVFIDFGFLLSATKDIIGYIKKGETPNKVIGETLYAQTILCLIAILAGVGCIFGFKILRGYELYTMLSLVTCLLSIFLFEYVFKAYEQMGKIAIRYVVMKVIALILTLLFVKSDKDILLIPIFDIISSIVAIVLVFVQLKKLGIKIELNLKDFKGAWKNLSNSFVYFISNFATTAFGALNTILIGIFLSTSDVAYWSVAMQLVAVVQALYNPIITSAHPAMIRTKNLKIIHKIMIIYMPLIFIGCGLIILLGDWAVTLVFTKNYLMSSKILKYLIPVLICSFPVMLYGWPCLDCINKTKATTLSTVVSSIIQIVGIGFVALIGKFNLISLVMVRNITEMVFCIIRMTIVYKNKKLYKSDNEENDLENVKKEKLGEFEKHELSNEIISNTIEQNKDV